MRTPKKFIAELRSMLGTLTVVYAMDVTDRSISFWLRGALASSVVDIEIAATSVV